MNQKYRLKKEVNNFVSRFNNKKYSEMLYESAFKKKINWDNPTEFNEKLMYLKVFKYSKDKNVWACADKYKERLFILKHGVLEKHLNKLIGVYDKTKDIKENDLPSKFVMKCTHGYGFNITCNDKNEFDFKAANRKLNKWQKTKFGYETGEIQYTHVKPRIIIEDFVPSKIDYKVYCFFGKPKVVLACSLNDDDVKLNFFDLKWNELMLGKEEYRSKEKICSPRYLKDMIGISKKVSSEFPFVRIDFYEDGRAVIGEMIFTPAACLATYYSEEGNKYLSDLLDLKLIK